MLTRIRGPSSTTSEAWPAENSVSYGSSVVAEPTGVWRAICRFVPPRCKTFHVFTDHLPLVYACKSGRTSCAHYNEFLERMRINYPSSKFLLFHVAGNVMLADGISRGLQGTRENEERAHEIAREIGLKEGSREVKDRMLFHPWMK